MTGETVVYKNEMNLVPLRKFTSTEIDLFFAMCNKLKEQDDNVLTIPFEDLKELSNYSSDTRNLTRFTDELERVYSKMLELTYTERTATKITKFVLFYKYEIDLEERTLQIATAPDLRHVLNNITSDFTKFDLQEMTHLKSTYAKNMFRYLKQYKHTGYLKMAIEDFRERLDIPNSYKMNDIDKRVFNPIIKELGTIFKDLNINKISAKKSRKIKWIEFTFEPEKRIHSKRQPEMVEHSKPKQNESREMTPEWLKNKDYEEGNSKSTEFTEEEREKFLKFIEEQKKNK
ncbi:replication initiation protein [Staphylococcus xylosus]|uniref:replication initiation protein n=1 Tax=Staphylococcus saprophyticus TaxID=29385 RepID=UPI000D1DC8B9|nr:RepB family plasmid replication initiator protein [Staphylococcus saprophyticus]PTK44655.1 replication protein Rep [Staphylococcus saprophyticus]